MIASPTPAFMSFGFSEMIVVGVVALLVFGGRLPEVMYSLGKAYAKLRRSMNEFTHPIRQEMRDLDVRSAVRRPPAREVPPAATQPPPYTTPEESVPLQRGAEEMTPESQGPPSTGGAADEPPPV